MSEKATGFARRLHETRKAKGWSQPELGEKIGTSGAIIGRYERGEMTPSIEVVKKLASALGVTLDYLVSDGEAPNVIADQAMLARWQEINRLATPERERIVSVIDSLVRDAKARQTYQASA